VGGLPSPACRDAPFWRGYRHALLPPIMGGPDARDGRDEGWTVTPAPVRIRGYTATVGRERPLRRTRRLRQIPSEPGLRRAPYGHGGRTVRYRHSQRWAVASASGTFQQTAVPKPRAAPILVAMPLHHRRRPLEHRRRVDHAACHGGTSPARHPDHRGPDQRSWLGGLPGAAPRDTRGALDQQGAHHASCPARPDRRPR
jgi:hypothetical protein